MTRLSTFTYHIAIAFRSLFQPRRRAFSLTYTGELIDLFDPDPAQIRVLDIAHALARTCRWNGHTRDHVSIAQHTVEVATLIEQWTDGNDPVLTFAALHHDDDEYLLPDLNGQIKPFMPEFERLSAIHQRAAQQAFGIPIGLHNHPLIQRADRFSLTIEARDQMGDRWQPTGTPEARRAPVYQPWPYETARDRFLEYHHTLMRRCERVGWRRP